MIPICIRDSRSANGPRTGNTQVAGAGGFVYVTPRVLAIARDPRLKEFFDARLRGEPVYLPGDIS